MAEESFPFQELVEGDRTVSAALFAKMLGSIRTTGVIKSVDNELAVTESSPQAMSIDLGTGAAFVGLSELRSYRNTLARTLTIAAADPTNPRHDLLVLDMDTTTSPDTRRITALIVQGTPAASPVDPSLTQTEARYQLVIARIVVGAAATSITNSDIADLRTFSEPGNFPASGGVFTRFTSSGTWTKGSGTNSVIVIAVGGGGGGAGAEGRAAGITRVGGGSGGGGGRTIRFYDATSLGATETITIGAGGAGGSGQTNGDGLDGGDGGDSTLGSVQTGFGGGGGGGNVGAALNSFGGGGGGAGSAGGTGTGVSGGTGGGLTGIASSGITGSAGNGTASESGGGAGAGSIFNATAGNGGDSFYGSSGGGAGGGVTNANAQQAGGDGGAPLGITNGGGGAGGAAGGSNGTAGAAGVDELGGEGGGGGGGNSGGTGGNGAVGGAGGGGGGGGGAGTNTGGNGAAGGDGEILVWEFS